MSDEKPKKKETHIEQTDSTGSYRIVGEDGETTKGEGKTPSDPPETPAPTPPPPKTLI